MTAAAAARAAAVKLAAGEARARVDEEGNRVAVEATRVAMEGVVEADALAARAGSTRRNPIRQPRMTALPRMPMATPCSERRARV